MYNKSRKRRLHLKWNAPLTERRKVFMYYNYLPRSVYSYGRKKNVSLNRFYRAFISYGKGVKCLTLFEGENVDITQYLIWRSLISCPELVLVTCPGVAYSTIHENYLQQRRDYGLQ